MSELNKKRNINLLDISSYSISSLYASDDELDENNNVKVIKKRSTVSNKIDVMKDETTKLKQNMKFHSLSVPSYIN